MYLPAYSDKKKNSKGGTPTVYVRSSAINMNRKFQIRFWDAFCLHVGNYNSYSKSISLFHETI